MTGISRRPGPNTEPAPAGRRRQTSPAPFETSFGEYVAIATVLRCSRGYSGVRPQVIEHLPAERGEGPLVVLLRPSEVETLRPALRLPAPAATHATSTPRSTSHPCPGRPRAADEVSGRRDQARSGPRAVRGLRIRAWSSASGTSSSFRTPWFVDSPTTAPSIIARSFPW